MKRIVVSSCLAFVAWGVLGGAGCNGTDVGGLLGDGGLLSDGANGSDSAADASDARNPEGGGVGDQCGGFTTGNATCDACLATQCCSESLACANVADDQCEELARCVAPCEDQTCQQNCANQHPTGVSALLTVVDCARNKCPSDCPTQ